MLVVLAPETLSPDERASRRMDLYGKLCLHFYVEQAYQIAEILSKPPERIKPNDLQLLKTLQRQIEKAIRSSIAHYLFLTPSNY